MTAAIRASAPTATWWSGAIGTLANGQFKILQSFDQVTGEPFLLKTRDAKLGAMSN